MDSYEDEENNDKKSDYSNEINDEYPRYEFRIDDDVFETVNYFNHVSNYESKKSYSNDESITDDNIHQFVRDYIYGYYKFLPNFLIIDEENLIPKPISEWDVSNVTNMDYLFAGFPLMYSFEKRDWEEFDENLNEWDVSNVTSMQGMFYYCKYFNQPLDKWSSKLSNCKDMGYMFSYCRDFNQPLDSWDVSNVENMEYMFFNCISFDQPLGSWNVSNCKNFNFMFNGNNHFKTTSGYEDDDTMNFFQDLSNWEINIEDKNNDMFNMFGDFMARNVGSENMRPLIFKENNEHFVEHTYNITRNEEGRAYEVHNIFKTLNYNRQKYLLDIAKREVGEPIEEYNINNIVRRIINSFSNFINSSENVDLNKEVYNEALSLIANRFDFPPDLQHQQFIVQLYGYVIDFIFRQPYIFKVNYVEACFKDCIYGYSNKDTPITLPINIRNFSCSAGIREKLILSLKPTIEIIFSINDDTIIPQMYKEMYKQIYDNVFQVLDINDLSQEWTENYLDNEKFKQRHGIKENDEESERKMKQSLINFLKKKYYEEGQLTDVNNEKINKEVEKYENMGVFKNLYFGGKKRKNIKKQTKKYKKINKSNKKYKKYKKINKSNKKCKKYLKKTNKKYKH